MNWLREHMRDHVANPAGADLSRNVLKLAPSPPDPSGNDATSTIGLVAEAAQVIKTIERRANESEVRAKTLAESAIEKLRVAESRIQAAEEARRAGEGILMQVRAKLDETENELKHTRSRLATAEAQHAAVELRMKNFEVRALNAEKAVNDVEHAIRTQLIGLTQELTKRASAAAA